MAYRKPKQAQVQLSPFQERVLAVPSEYDLFLGGGRGGAKSYCLALLVIREVAEHGRDFRGLYIRKTYGGLSDFEGICFELFPQAFPGARYNGASHIWRFPNGAYFELGQLQAQSDYPKYQGRSFTHLLIDETGQYATPDMLDRLRSNLRAPKGVPVRVVLSANPADVGHHWLASRYVFQAPAWVPFYEEKSGREWVYCPSTYKDNPFIDADTYAKQLESACPTDPELLRAWLSGDWSVVRGSFFAAVLDEHRNCIDPWPHLPHFDFYQAAAHLLPAKKRAFFDEGWDFYLSMDYGSSAPAVIYLCGKSPGAEAFGKFYPRGSVVLIDELATNVPGQLNQGLGWTIPTLADAIKSFSEHWRIRPQGCADDACFSSHGHAAGSIATEFSANGVRFYPAQKGGRLVGWEVMKKLLQGAGEPDVPGLYISRACTYFWQTVPYLARDPRKPDDVDSSGPDHGADAARYACTFTKPTTKTVPVVGL